MAFPNMLLDLNNCLSGPISDHSPMTVDLSFKDPTMSASKPSIEETRVWN